MQLSDAGFGMLKDSEGFRTRAYRDQGGVVTIGYGFTMLSTVFSRWWLAHHDRPLRMGDAITRNEADPVLRELVAAEYGAAVDRKFGNSLPQYQYDAVVHVVYNTGAGTLTDPWAQYLAAGNVQAAADALKRTRTTARGNYSAGLLARRAAEAHLLLTGEYPATTAASVHSTDIEAYQQQLATLGYYTAEVDGVAGPKTNAAVRAFQRAQGLVEDGVVGPATRASLDRAVQARTARGVTTAVAVASAGGGIMVDSLHGLNVGRVAAVVAVVVAVMVVGILIWRNRGRIWRKSRAPAT